MMNEKETADVVVHGDARGFGQEIVAGKHRFVADEPASAGGGEMKSDHRDVPVRRRYRARSLRLFAGGAWSLHVHDGRAVRPPKTIASR